MRSSTAEVRGARGAEGRWSWILLGPSLIVGFCGLALGALEVRTQEVVWLQARTAHELGRAEPLALELAPGETRSLAFETDWPKRGRTLQVQLIAQDAGPSPLGGRRVALEATLELADGRRVRSARMLDVDASTTALFELYRIGKRSLTLILQAKQETRTHVSTRPSVGPPIAFRLEIQRVLSGRTISLETNLLRTFVGEPVSYSFSLGTASGDEGAMVRLLPLRLDERIAELEMEISGTLPLENEQLLAVARTERWHASPEATTTIRLESGEPPSGYRFLVTARF